MLSDPSGGAGYAFGQNYPSTHATTIANQQVRALDVVSGGTWSLNATSTVQDGGGEVIWEAAQFFDNATFRAGGAGTQIDHTMTVDAAAGGAIVWSGVSAVPALGAREVARPIRLNEPLLNVGSRWTFHTSGYHWYQSDVTDGGNVVWPLDQWIPNATLKRILIWAHGNLHGAGHGSMPAVMPSFGLYRANATITPTAIGTNVLLATGGSPEYSNNVANYDVAHLITLDNSGVDINEGPLSESNSYSYYLTVVGESGSNKVLGFTIINAWAVYAVSAIQP